MKTGVGFDLPEGEERVTGVEILTGDTNIISVAMTLQYVIRNPSAFLFQIENPPALIGSLAESVLTETVLGMPVDEMLTTGRLAIQEHVKTRTQGILDHYDSGIQITSPNIMGITLDRSVAQAFQDVANASADRENKINQGRSYANDLLPKARGEARSIVLSAQSYREQRVAEAIGNTTRFLELLAEYNKAPEVTRTRDRKSTRLNSSHGYISYAVFCLKQKNKSPSPSRSQGTGRSGPRHASHRPQEDF